MSRTKPRSDRRHKMLLRFLVTVLAAQTLSGCSYTMEYGGTGLILPGMNQTELQGVMGPPDYIQVRGQRQAWQYCPHLFDGRNEDLYVTVWLTSGRVDHMRAYGADKIATCPDYLAAFRWEDVIDGEFVASSTAATRVK